jgi:hypothetical protein
MSRARLPAGLTISNTLKVCLVGPWLFQKLSWAVSCGKVAVRKHLWEKQKTIWLVTRARIRLPLTVR